MKSNILLLFSFLFLIVGCGSRFNFNRNIPIEKTPHFFPFADFSCFISNHDHTQLTVDKIGLQEVWRSTPVKQQIINSPIVKDLFYFFPGGTLTPILFCPESASFGHYPKGSVEAVGISAYISISESYEFYKKVAKRDYLPEHHLSLVIAQGLLEKNNPNNITDGIFYSDDGAVVYKKKSPSIVILPHNEELLRTNKELATTPYWMKRFMLAREFGHFIFSQYNTPPDSDEMRRMSHIFANLFAQLVNQEIDESDLQEDLLASHIYHILKEFYPKATSQDLGKILLMWIDPFEPIGKKNKCQRCLNIQERIVRLKELLQKDRDPLSKEKKSFDKIFHEHFPAYF